MQLLDGSYRNKKPKCVIKIKKERKKKRLEELFARMNLEYGRTESKEYSIYSFYTPRNEKYFSSYWYDCSLEQLKVIADEVLHWDGSQTKNRRTFSTTIKESAEFIQFVFSSTGSRATIYSQNRIGELHKSIEYTVVISNNKLISLAKSASQNNKSRITEVETKDGFQYCFTVPSGNLVLRRNSRIFITGNSGKSHICTAIVNHLLNQGNESLYMKWRDDSVALKKSIMGDSDEYVNLINRYKNVKVLYVDDFFKTELGKPPTSADIMVAFEILNHRYINQDLITLISTEKSIDELLNIDEAIGSRIYQRSKQYCIQLSSDKNKNMRMKL